MGKTLESYSHCTAMNICMRLQNKWICFNCNLFCALVSLRCGNFNKMPTGRMSLERDMGVVQYDEDDEESLFSYSDKSTSECISGNNSSFFLLPMSYVKWL